MSLYRHIDPGLSREQAANFVKLARHLVIASQAEAWNPLHFDIGHAAVDLMTGDELAPDQVARHGAPMMCGLLGFGPQAGIAALPGEDWRGYQERVLGAAFDSPLEDWLFSSLWRGTDNTPAGAAMRMKYVLDYGVPGDWMEIAQGRNPSDYMDNGFLWERVGLMPPERT